ncbi:hypothetical protein BH18THE1_BH18THE1_05550 [soil metagenome]
MHNKKESKYKPESSFFDEVDKLDAKLVKITIDDEI